MRFLFIIVAFCLCNGGIIAQITTAKQAGNKEKLAQMDSLLRIMTKKKDQLANLLTDFTNVSKQLEKNLDSSVKGRTINDRLRSVERNASERIKTGKGQKISSSVSKLEQITAAIKRTQQEFNEASEKWNDKKDSISEMNEMDMLMLQQIMERKNQLETLISNVMKAGFEGGQAAIQALKAS